MSSEAAGTAIIAAIIVVICILLVAVLGALVGAFAGWIVGFTPLGTWILGFFSAMNIHTNMVDLGTTCGFVCGFFTSKFYSH